MFLSLIITGFPFTFLLTSPTCPGVDPRWSRPPQRSAPAPGARFRHVLLPLLLPGLAITFCLSFVQAFSVFPSAVLLGAPAGPTRVISIAAYQAAFEEFDYSHGLGDRDDHGLVSLSSSPRVLRRARPALSRPGRRRERADAMTATPPCGERLWAAAVWTLVGLLHRSTCSR